MRIIQRWNPHLHSASSSRVTHLRIPPSLASGLIDRLVARSPIGISCRLPGPSTEPPRAVEASPEVKHREGAVPDRPRDPLHPRFRRRSLRSHPLGWPARRRTGDGVPAIGGTGKSGTSVLLPLFCQRERATLQKEGGKDEGFQEAMFGVFHSRCGGCNDAHGLFHAAASFACDIGGTTADHGQQR